jgi:hypothetical protein
VRSSMLLGAVMAALGNSATKNGIVKFKLK